MKNIKVVTGLDLETTGFEVGKGARVTEFCFAIYHYDMNSGEFEQKKVITRLVNPMCPISEKIQSITGITPAMVATAKPFEFYAPAIDKIIKASDCLIAHNMDFDGKFLFDMFALNKMQMSLDSEPFCTMQNGRFATAMGKVPKLSELAHSYGIDFDGVNAHRADYDTLKMMDCFVLGVNKGDFKPKFIH